MSILKSVATAIFITWVIASGTLAADNSQTAKLAGTACVNYLTGHGANNAFLQQYGFKKRSKSFFRKATGLGLTGHTDRANIKLHKSECEYRFGTNRDGRSAFNAFSNTFKAAGLEAVQVKSGRNIILAYKVGTKIYKIHGSTGSYNNSFYTLISVSTR